MKASFYCFLASYWVFWHQPNSCPIRDYLCLESALKTRSVFALLMASSVIPRSVPPSCLSQHLLDEWMLYNSASRISIFGSCVLTLMSWVGRRGVIWQESHIEAPRILPMLTMTNWQHGPWFNFKKISCSRNRGQYPIINLRGILSLSLPPLCRDFSISVWRNLSLNKVDSRKECRWRREESEGELLFKTLLLIIYISEIQPWY